MRKRWIRPAGVLGAGALALPALFTACEGENLFTPGSRAVGSDDRPPSVEILQPREPAAFPIGDSVRVVARARDGAGIDSLRFEGFSVRGDPDLGTAVVVERLLPKSVALASAPRDTTVTRYLTAAPDDVREPAFVVVTAWDADGSSSADTVRIELGGPRVQLLNVTEGQRVQNGQSLSIRIEAFDPDGIISVQLDARGVFDETIRRSFSPPVETTTVDTVLVIPGGLSGALSLVARARNTLDIAGRDSVNVAVVSAAEADQLAPTLSMSVSAPPRMEVQDSVKVGIMGADNTGGSGVARAGYTVIARSPSRGTQVVQGQERTFTPPRTGNVIADFAFAPFNFDPTSFPDTLVFEVTAYMYDAVGNCGATVVADQPSRLPCEVLPGGQVVAQGQAGLSVPRPVVAGHTVRLPVGGLILDAVVDTVRRNLILSNHTRDRLEIFRLEEERFLPSVPVGSQPWGLMLNRTGDTVLVANSGGTNISNVYLGPVGSASSFQPSEDAGRRFLTPDVVLFDIQRTLDDVGRIRYFASHHPNAQGPSFSDRPQFIAGDFTGRLLYSTKTTLLGSLGTIRKAFVLPGASGPEVQLFYQHANLQRAPDFIAVANVDNVLISAVDDGDRVTLVDHVPGGTAPITGGPSSDVAAAAAELASQGSDVTLGSGRWDVPALAFGDTTYVTASGDRRWVVFGEGSISPVGRIIMYDAAGDDVSGVIQVTDLMTNSSETVRGIGLNHDGTLGVARGAHGYFFSTDLRLQGFAALPGGGAGAVLHPLHADYRSLSNPGGSYHPDTHLAFLGTGEGTIDIIDAFHFNRLGRLFIRDVVSGPLRAVLPFPEDNAGMACESRDVRSSSGALIGRAVRIYQDELGNVPYGAENSPTVDECIVLKLVAPTSSGGVVVVDVRKADILRNHPSRQ